MGLHTLHFNSKASQKLSFFINDESDLHVIDGQGSRFILFFMFHSVPVCIAEARAKFLVGTCQPTTMS